jgi:hypothetical protein
MGLAKHLACRTLVENPNGKRSLGREKRRCKIIIKMGVREVG